MIGTKGKSEMNRGIICMLISVLTLCGISSASERYEFRADHDPNGIGKFYFNREIAHVMGFGPGGQGAVWLERSTREREERLALLVRSLRLKQGDVVADIGAGSGVVSLLMADAVGPEGKVLAVDVQEEMLERLRMRCEELQVKNVVPVKGDEDNPNLAAGTVDLAIMVDVYHEFEFPWEMMLEISRAMKPGGRVVLVEYRREDPEVPIKLVHKMSQRQVRTELEQPEFDLRWTETIHVLPRQHIIVFTRRNQASKE
jgi:ubiquinone/menaquinone biosynthesis C-methylase UbiE